MIRFIFFFVLLMAAAWAGTLLSKDPGQLIVDFQGYTLSMPLWLAAAILLLGFLLVHWVLRVVRFFRGVGEKAGNYLVHRRISKSREKTNLGLIALNEGKWKQAEKYLITGAEDSETPLINYLAAARCAQEQGEDAKRDNYLRIAQQSTPDADLAVELTQAELQLDHGQLEQATASLKHLHDIAPKNKQVMKLLHRIYMRISDWRAAQLLLSDLERYQVLDSAQFEKDEKVIYQGLVQSIINDGNIEDLKDAWSTFPNNVTTNPNLLIDFVQELIDANEFDEADDHIRSALKKHWDKALIDLWGQLDGHVEKRLRVGEKWLRDHQDDAHLLLALGRMCAKTKLWGKARTYFENALALEPRAEIFKELGHLLEELGEPNEAMEYYRSGLESSLQLDDSDNMPVPLDKDVSFSVEDKTND